MTCKEACLQEASEAWAVGKHELGSIDLALLNSVMLNMVPVSSTYIPLKQQLGFSSR